MTTHTHEAGFETFQAHFPDLISKDVVKYATDVALLSSRYLFVKRAAGVQFGYCTHCKQSSMTTGDLKHNQEAACPKCQSKCKVKQSGISRKHLRDSAFFMHYEKSIVNPQAIVARAIYVTRDYSGDYKTVENKYECDHMYLFEQGNCEHYEYSWGGHWVKRKSIISAFETKKWGTPKSISYLNVKKAVKNTPFAYCTWEQYFDKTYNRYDMLKFFELASKYPCVEYLTKMGLKGFVDAKLNGRGTHGAIHWRGKTIEKVLRMTKAEIKAMRSAKVELRPGVIHSYQYHKKQGIILSFEEAEQMASVLDGYYFSTLKKILQKHSLSFSIMSKYILKQMKKEGAEKYYRYGSQVLIALQDYWRECEELGKKLNYEHILLPNNLHAAHKETSAKIKVKKDKSLNERIAKRLPELEKYSFETEELFIRPAKDSIELFLEGKTLLHCVGGYAQGYAEGRTNVFFLRKKSAPDVPFYTIEIKDNKITQAYGYDNCLPTEEVKAFLREFVGEKLTKKNRAKKPEAKMAQIA